MSQSISSNDSKGELPDGISKSIYPANGAWFCSKCFKWFNGEPEAHYYECLMRRLEGNETAPSLFDTDRG